MRHFIACSIFFGFFLPVMSGMPSDRHRVLKHSHAAARYTNISVFAGVFPPPPGTVITIQ